VFLAKKEGRKDNVGDIKKGNKLYQENFLPAKYIYSLNGP